MLPFYKYHGAGNDFILLDDRAGGLHEQFEQATIAHWCDRHFGIGADGMMFLRSHPDYDFEMIYYNADGAPSSMCGNGGRCLVRFAADLDAIGDSCRFLAVDGPHEAKLLADGNVSLGMNDVKHENISRDGDAYVLDTGSPHFITQVANCQLTNVVTEGKRVRYSPRYTEKGINVNFISGDANGLSIATYERGVEDETLACGTGVTAAAIATVLEHKMADGTFRIPVKAKGGDLAVRGILANGNFHELWLEGPAVRVFIGQMAIR